MIQERNTIMGSMRAHCTKIETELHATKVMFSHTMSIETKEKFFFACIFYLRYDRTIFISFFFQQTELEEEKQKADILAAETPEIKRKFYYLFEVNTCT